jgi:hypothetical protein
VTQRWRVHVGLYPKPDADPVYLIDQTMTQDEINEPSEIHVIVRRGDHVRFAQALAVILNREAPDAPPDQIH